MKLLRAIVESPYEPNDTNVLWVDTSIDGVPTLRKYANGFWTYVSSAGTSFIVNVDTLPVASKQTLGKMYATPSENPHTGDTTDEWLTVVSYDADGIPSYSWEQIGQNPDLSQFITKSVDNLENYYLKSETYTQQEITDRINASKNLVYLVVDALPQASSSTLNSIYLVEDSQQEDVYNMYITQYESDTYSWVNIGNTSIALSQYATKDTDAVENNIAKFDANGNPVDGGIPVEYITQLGQEVHGSMTALSGWNTGEYVKTAQGVGNVCTKEIVSSSSWRSIIVTIQQNVKYYIVNGVGGGVPRLWCFLDSNNIILSVANMSISASNNELKLSVPTGATQIIINSNTSSTEDSYSIVEGLSQDVEGLSEDVEELSQGVEGLSEDVDGLSQNIEGVNLVVYNNEGQIPYYKNINKYCIFNGIGCYTPLLTACTINKIVLPPFKSERPAGISIAYYIAFGDLSSSITPSNLTFIAQGTINGVATTLIEDYVVELDSGVVIPNGKILFVFFYSSDNQVFILGGGNSATEDAPYGDDDCLIFFNASSGQSTPFSSTWSKASPTTTARYKCCNPILKYIVEGLSQKTSELQQEVSELSQEVAKVNVYLPRKIYAVVGDTLQLFFQSIIGDIDVSNYDVYVECQKGKTLARYYEYTPVLADIGTTTLKLYVRNRFGKILGYGECQLQTVAEPISPLSSKSIFTFGDSLTSGGVWVGEAKRRLVATSTYDNIEGKGLENIEFFGYKQATINGTLVDYFGEGGWTWASYIQKASGGAFRFYVSNINQIKEGAVYSNNGHNYTIQEINVTGTSGNIRCTTSSNENVPLSSGTLTKVSGNGDATIAFSSFDTENANPLWDDANNKMSFIPYLQDCGATTIDAVYVLLTWNNLPAWAEYSPEDISGHIANAKVFARTLHSEFPNAKLFIMGVQMPSLTGGLGYNYGATGIHIDSYGEKQAALNYNKALQDLCETPEFSSYCEFVAVAPQFDSLYNMPYTMKNVNTRNSDKQEIFGINGVHPSDAGYFQIADAVYRSIVANFCQSE